MYSFELNGKLVQSRHHPSDIPKLTGYTNVKEVPALGVDTDGLFDAIADFDAEGNPVFDMVKAKKIKVKEAQRLASEAMKVITDNYEPHEIATWDIQEAEARGNTPDNYLLGLELASGVPLADLKAKIIANADAYRQASANAVGKRQKMEAACMDATTIEELKAVVF